MIDTLIEMPVVTSVTRVGCDVRSRLVRLRASAPTRVLTMSSGGICATGLEVDHLEMTDDDRGAEQYARAHHPRHRHPERRAKL